MTPTQIYAFADSLEADALFILTESKPTEDKFTKAAALITCANFLKKKAIPQGGGFGW